MPGTAATQAEEFRAFYKLDVEVIPTNRPVIRIDEPDVVFPSKHDKEQAAVEEIRRVHATGPPILVGTASVEESERLSAALSRLPSGTPHFGLTTRTEEAEARIAAAAAGSREAT